MMSGITRWRIAGLATLAVVAVLVGVLLARRGDGSLVIHTIPLGATPTGVVVDERSGRAFIASENSNTVSVVDTRAGTLLRTVHVGYGPGAMAVDARAGRVLVVNDAALSLSVLNARSGRIVRTVPFNASPMGLALDARAARAFVAKADQTIDTLDARSGRLLHTASASVSVAQNEADAAQVAVDERAGRVFFINAAASGGADGSVVTLDAASGRLLRSTTAGPDTMAVAVDARTGRTFVANGASVSVLDTHSGALLRTVPVGPSSSSAPLIAGTPLVDARTGRVFVVTYNYAGNHTGRVFVLDAASGRLVRVTTSGVIPQMALLDAPTGRVFVFGFDGLSVLDARSGARLRQTAASSFASSFPAQTGAGSFPAPMTPASVAVDERSGRVFVIGQGPDNGAGGTTGSTTDNGHVTVLDGRSGAILHTMPVGVGPIALAVDSRAGRVLVLNSGGTVSAPDPLGWLPSWLRRLLPFARPGKRIVPASVSIFAER